MQKVKSKYGETEAGLDLGTDRVVLGKTVTKMETTKEPDSLGTESFPVLMKIGKDLVPIFKLLTDKVGKLMAETYTARHSTFPVSACQSC